jgi:VanZ family protein
VAAEGDAGRARERFWWRAAAAYLVALYLSLYPIQFAMDFLRAHDLLRASLAASFTTLGVLVVIVVARHRAGPLEWLALAAIAAVYVAQMSRMGIVQERFHLAEYGGLALILHAALRARFSRPERSVAWLRTAAAVGAWVLASAAGWLDELIQAVLPNRRYDLRDVGFNALAAALALVGWWALEAARARDRARARRN